MKHFLNTSSYFKNHFTKSSRAIVNISIITSLALSQSLAAVNLPSGGKFVNGTGSITTNGNTMNITGDKTHNVIAWGGGFNIGKDNTVNFTTNSKSYLNLDYTNKASQILGTLNGGTNNVYIVNPSGVLVGEGATINANKFGASTTPMDMNAINTFSDNGFFSPVFESNKGDIVNLGSIKANEIVLVGNKVENIKGKLQGKDQTFADTVTIKGDKVYLEGAGINAINLDAEIGSEGYFRYEAKDLYEKYETNAGLLDNYNFIGAVTNGNFKECLYIGSQSASNEEMINSWMGFINLFNEKKLEEWGFNDIYLENDIDFTSATFNPIGDSTNPFAGNFYGNNHTLSNIQINVDNMHYAGLFGYIAGGSFQDLRIDGLSFSNNLVSFAGGFAGYIGDGTFSNISLNNIKNIQSQNYSGGFTGYVTNGTFSNIDLSNIVNISSNWAAGGFSGWIDEGVFSNIGLNNIGAIKVDAIYAYAGGFSGAIKSGAFSSIILDNIESIVSNNTEKYTGYSSGALAGGFAGYITGEGTFENIILNNIGKISTATEFDDVYTNTGGFAGYINGGAFENIVLNNIDDISGRNYVGGFAGWITKGNDISFSDVILNNIENIIANATNKNAYAGGFTGYADTGTYKNIILNNIGEISANSATQQFIYAGGFAGRVKSGSINFSDIVLNNIEKISASNSTGGFVGNIESGSNITNSDIYFYGSLDSSLNKDYIAYDENILSLSNSTDLQTLQTNSGISGLEYLKDTSGKSYLHMINNNGYIGNGDSKITFDKDNFTYNTPKIPEVNPDNPSSSSTVPNEGKLTSVTLEQNDFNKEILESILGGSSLEFDLLSGDLESIRQSLDFLTAFLKDDNTISDLFGYIPSDKYDSNVYNKFTGNLQADIEKAIQDKVLDLDFLKEYRASLEKYNNDKKLYESGLLHPEFQAALDKELEKQYANLLGLEDRVNSMLEIFGDYKLILDKDKKIFNKEGSNLKFKVGIGELVNYKNTEGGGENNNNFNPPSDLSKQTELSSKEPVFVLPVEETQNAIDEAKIELGRVCIVSDNAKTSNPCIAIAF
ncbi:filamentous hemagglutinin N-terminal domain-containing protein [Campylobacter lari]|nr:filamentous hemagglutinin N-terminal domain-containing protein [Campylobacter lari]